MVHLLLTGEEDGSLLSRRIGLQALTQLRAEVATELPLSRAMLVPSPHTRRMGPISEALLPVVPILAAAHDGPIDVLVDAKKKAHASGIILPRTRSHDLPSGSTTQLYEDVSVTLPEFTLLQLASRASLPRTVMLASELCGSFAVYDPPEPIRAVLQKLADSKKGVPTVGGWKPFVGSDGKVSTIWSRQPITTSYDLRALARSSESRRGCGRLSAAAELVKPNAASPFEVQTGILLGFPRRLGGEGLPAFEHNAKVAFPSSARLLAGKRHCYCDLFWEGSDVDLECQSTLVHQNAKSYLSDSERTAALRSMGVDVLPVTFEQIKSRESFHALSKTLAGMLGVRVRPKTEAQLTAEAKLRGEVFLDWETIHHV